MSFPYMRLLTETNADATINEAIVDGYVIAQVDPAPAGFLVLFIPDSPQADLLRQSGDVFSSTDVDTINAYITANFEQGRKLCAVESNTSGAVFVAFRNPPPEQEMPDMTQLFEQLGIDPEDLPQ